nr:phospholipase D-like domain-containing protein [Aestuariimicrobium ganziense]
MVNDFVRRRHRKPYRFPVTDPTPVMAGEDEVVVHTFGAVLYEDMLDAIDQARETVMFETYIWKGDEVGQRFKDALTRAAARGVAVHVIYDAFANLVVPPSFFEFDPRIMVRRHPVISSLLIRPRTSGRDHRKLLVVDSSVAFVGGYNIGSLYADRWRDTHARITGPSVAEFENAFVDQWNTHPIGVLAPFQRRTPLPSPSERIWEGAIRVHRNSPRWMVYPIRNMYLEAIDRASERIWLTHGYLIPDDDLVAALYCAARRGVDVRVIVPARSNHVIADWLSRGFYADLLAKGVRLFLYQGAMVHAKTAVVDGVWSTIGTANLDRLSLLGNYEVNAEFTSADVAHRMQEVFEVDLGNCRELTVEEWRTRSHAAKLTEQLLAPWRPIF